ncbi:uncharacterized protein LOC123269107 [Cotesia glomerata]|uniref:uncharacterized protein LOC123269107 n=1 Tax=Cotesia glomerata TaxID=32391 RepID=UPI001D02C27A|nr:uncharacterized protein LOC123269107 [Cotesia glomerata]
MTLKYNLHYSNISLEFYFLGIYYGAGVELEKALGRELIWLPCRQQTGPNVPIFNRFKGFWNKIDKSKFKAGIEDTAVDQALSDITDEILGFIGEYLQKYHPRSDYREFLELSSVFLGIVPKENFSFKSPGAMSHARWMSKAIYCLKIFIFREEFKLTTYEINSLREICKFIITNYITAWFTSSSATLAAQHDLIFMQKLIRYKAVNLAISTATTEKIKNHL